MVNDSLDTADVKTKFPEIWEQAVGVFVEEQDALDFFQRENWNLDGQTPYKVMTKGEGERVVALISSGEHGLTL